MLGEQWRDPVDITKEQWVDLLEDRDIVMERDFHLLKVIYSCENCRATAKQLARLLHLPSHSPLNIQVGQLGRRIVQVLNISALRKHPSWQERQPEYSITSHANTCSFCSEKDAAMPTHRYDGKQAWSKSNQGYDCSR